MLCVIPVEVDSIPEAERVSRAWYWGVLPSRLQDSWDWVNK